MKKLFILYIICIINASIACDSGWFDMDPPEVTSIIPVNRSIGVSQRPEIQISFSEPMDTAKTEEAISIYTGDHQPKGYFRWKGKTVYFDLLENLDNASTCVIQVRNSAEDTNGNNILETVTSVFSVGTDFVRPSVESITPVDGTLLTNPFNTVVITFSEPVSEESLESGFTLSPYVNGFKTLSDDGTVLTFTPYERYLHATNYSITLDASITDLSGNQLVTDYTSSFTMGTDFISPTLNPGNTDPVDQDVGAFSSYSGTTTRLAPSTVTDGADKEGRITLVFSEAMTRMETENAVAISPSIPLSYNWENPHTLHLDGTGTPYTLEEVYTLTVSSGACDLQGNPIDSKYEFPFVINGPHSQYIEVIPFGNNAQYIEQVDHAGTSPERPLYQDDTIDHGYSGIEIINTESENVYIFRVSLENSAGTLNTTGIDILSAIQSVSFHTVTCWHDRDPVTPRVWKVEEANGHPEAIDIYVFHIESETYYELIIQGGSEGIRDIEGNYMIDTFHLFVNS